MMPRTLACFGLALVVLVAALVLPSRPPAPLDQRLLLDLDGVREVEVRGDGGVAIAMGGKLTPAIEWSPETGEVRQAREGDRLVLELPAQASPFIRLQLPASVQSLVVPGARIDAGEGVAQLDIRTTGDLVWNGDAVRLAIHDARPRGEDGEGAHPPAAPRAAAAAATLPDDCLGACGQIVGIESGRIGELVVHLRSHGLRINQPSQVGDARLHLGSDAWVSLGPLRDLANLHIQQDEVAAADAPTTEPEE